MENNEAFGWPKSTVRAIALFTVLANITIINIAFCAGAIWGPVKEETLFKILTMVFVPLMTGVIGFYFGNKGRVDK